MAGTDDPLLPLANGRILAKLIPNAGLATIDDGQLFLVTSTGRSAEDDHRIKHRSAAMEPRIMPRTWSRSWPSWGATVRA